MARPPKRKVPGGKVPGGKGSGGSSGGRVTPKGGGRTTPKGGGPEASGRYTPPVPQDVKVSPIWVPILMFVFLGLGAVVIFLNYLGALPGATSNWYLLVGLGFILAGIITATNFH